MHVEAFYLSLSISSSDNYLVQANINLVDALRMTNRWALSLKVMWEVLPTCYLDSFLVRVLPTSSWRSWVQLQFLEPLIAVVDQFLCGLHRSRGGILTVLPRVAEAQRSRIVRVAVNNSSRLMMWAVFAWLQVVEVVTIQVDDPLFTVRALQHLHLALLGGTLAVLCFQLVSVAFLHLQVLLFLIHITGCLSDFKGLSITDRS